jgi:long-chain fatty acid transport protein
MKKRFLLIGSLLCSSLAYGQAYQLNMQGMRQLAMGGSGAAIPWDASAVFYNPGALAALENPQIYASMNAVMPRTRYISAPTGTGMQDAEEQVFTPYNVYFATPVGYKTRFTAGFGIYTPFGTGINWGNDWTGRNIVQEMRLNTTFFQPTLAFQVSDEISVGAGFVYATGNFKHTNTMPVINANGDEATRELTGRASGVGFNLGLHIRAAENVQFGITYRSQVNMKIRNGYARFANIPTYITGSYLNTSFESTLPMPQVLTVGAGWDISEWVTLQLEANYTGWAANDSLKFDFDNNTDMLPDESSARRYRNSITLRAGAKFNFRNERWSAMLGTAYVPSPVREGYLNPSMPDAVHFLATGGLSWKLSKRISLIGALEYRIYEVRTGKSTEHGFKGKYHTKWLNPGLAISYDFN